MTALQKVVKYLAIAFAIMIIVSIATGILSLVGVVAGFSDDGVLDEMKTYDISEEIRDIDIDISASKLTIKSAEKFSVESNLKRLTVEVKNGCLRVHEKSSGLFGYFRVNMDDAVTEISIPEGFTFGSASVDTGAGDVKIEDLRADKIDIDVGAGRVEIENIVANNLADIDTGAGKVTVRGGSINSLDLDLGAGEADLSIGLTGFSNIDCGVGKTTLTLNGSKDDYSVKISKGVGSITVDGESVSDGKVIGSGASKVDIDGGVGSVTVRFDK